MNYNFNGWQHAGEVKAINHEYGGIETPLDMYDALCEAWCIDTCAPRLRELWSEQHFANAEKRERYELLKERLRQLGEV